MDVLGGFQREVDRFRDVVERAKRYPEPPGFCRAVVANECANIPGGCEEGGATGIGPLADEVAGIEEDEEAAVAVEGVMAPAAALSGAELLDQDRCQRALNISRFHGCKDIGGGLR